MPNQNRNDTRNIVNDNLEGHMMETSNSTISLNGDYQQQQQQQNQQSQQQEAAEGIDAPVVLQCKECRAILGDTCSFVASDEEMNTLTLSGVSAFVQLASTTSISINSKGSKDDGCSYIPITCSICKSTLGKMYSATRKHLDVIRDMYTFSIPAITSYVLGSGGACPPESLLASSSSLQDQIIRLQRILLVVHERLEKLEASASQKS